MKREFWLSDSVSRCSRPHKGGGNSKAALNRVTSLWNCIFTVVPVEDHTFLPEEILRSGSHNGENWKESGFFFGWNQCNGIQSAGLYSKRPLMGLSWQTRGLSDTQLQEGQRRMWYDRHIDQHFHLKRNQEIKIHSISYPLIHSSL